MHNDALLHLGTRPQLMVPLLHSVDACSIGCA